MCGIVECHVLCVVLYRVWYCRVSCVVCGTVCVMYCVWYCSVACIVCGTVVCHVLCVVLYCSVACIVCGTVVCPVLCVFVCSMHYICGRFISHKPADGGSITAFRT